MSFGIKLVQNGVTLAAGTDTHPAPITVAVAELCFLSFTGTTATYDWALTARPPGSGTVISSRTSPGPTMLTDIDGGSYSITFTDSSANAYVLDIVTPTIPVVAGSGGVVPFVTTIAGLRTAGATSTSSATYDVKCYSVIGDGGGGSFDYDSTDTTSADNNGTIIVAGTRRYKRRYSGPVHATWFGADPTGATDASTPFANAIAASDHVVAPPGTFKLTSGIALSRQGVCLELARGSQLRTAAPIDINAPECSIIGYAYGNNLNSDGSLIFKSNIVWTGSTNSRIIGISRGTPVVSSDGSVLSGLFLDANGISGMTGFLIGKTSNGSSGLKISDCLTIDMLNGMNIESSTQQSWIDRVSHLRRSYATFSSGTGLLMGTDANYVGAITSVWITGGSIQGFTTGIQLGGATGPVNTVRVRDVNMDGFPGTGAKYVYIYDAFDARIEGFHMENSLNTDFTNRGIVVGGPGKSPRNVLIFGNYIAGCNVAIEGVGWDGMWIMGNNIDATAADGTHLGQAFKNSGGGGVRTSGSWGPNMKVGRGAFSAETDLSSNTGFTFIAGQNRDGNNVVRGQLKMSTENGWTIANNGTQAVFPATVAGVVTLMLRANNYVAQFGVADALAPVELSDPAALYTNTAGTGGQINFYVTGGNLTLQNKTGGTVNVSVRLDEA